MEFKIKKIEFKPTMVVKFVWATWWLLFGAAIAVHNGFAGILIGVFALFTLAIADLFMFVVRVILEHAGIGGDSSGKG